MISAMKKLALISAAALLPALPAAAQTPEPTGPALWLVSDEDTQIYLFGTLHILPSDTPWFIGPVTTAFEHAEEIVFEAPQGAEEEAGAITMRLAVLPPGQSWRPLMNEEDSKQYEAALGQIGLPAAAFDQLEPWAVGASLAVLPLMQAGFQTENGADVVLNALAEGKLRSAFETPEQQLGYFDNLPMETQLAWLDSVVETVPDVVQQMRLLIDSWLTRDIESIAELVSAGMPDPAVYKQLVTDRNANWVQWIERRLEQPGTVLVAVGAGHLAGRGSVQEQLAERDIESVRVQ